LAIKADKAAVDHLKLEFRKHYVHNSDIETFRSDMKITADEMAQKVSNLEEMVRF